MTILKVFKSFFCVFSKGPLTELSSLFRGYFGAARSDSPVLGYQIPEPSIDIQNDDIMAPQIVATKPMAVEIEVETEENAPQIAEQFKVINNDDVDTGEDNFAEEMPPELELSHEEIVETEEPLQDLIEAQPSLPEEEIAAKVPGN